MTFSGYNVEQRSKEVKALQSFLTYSFIGSMALHIALLASGLGNFLTRVPQVEEEPIEIAIVDPVTEEKEKPPEETPEVKKPDHYQLPVVNRKEVLLVVKSLLLPNHKQQLLPPFAPSLQLYKNR